LGIFSRAGDILTANLNEIVDRFEKPGTDAQAGCREMEGAISASRQDVARRVADGKILARQLAASEEQVKVWGQRAREAVKASDDLLARKAIARRLDHEGRIEAFRRRHGQIYAATETIRERLEAMEAKLREARRRLGTLVAASGRRSCRARAASWARTPKFPRRRRPGWIACERRWTEPKAEADALASYRPLQTAEGRQPWAAGRLRSGGNQRSISGLSR